MHSFFLSKISQIKEFDDVLDRELAFLDNKNIDLKKSQNLQFSKGVKAGLHATICWPDLSARQCRSANRTCILTPDLRPIRENENRPDSENLLQCNRFLCSRADTFKEADMSIKILSREHAYKSEAIKMADKKTPKRPKSRSFQEEEISLLISEWFKYPCLFDKGSKDYHDKNKREIARTHIARSLNEQASTSCFSFSSLFVS